MSGTTTVTDKVVSGPTTTWPEMMRTDGSRWSPFFLSPKPTLWSLLVADHEGGSNALSCDAYLSVRKLDRPLVLIPIPLPGKTIPPYTPMGSVKADGRRPNSRGGTLIFGASIFGVDISKRIFETTDRGKGTHQHLR